MPDYLKKVVLKNRNVFCTNNHFTIYIFQEKPMKEKKFKAHTVEKEEIRKSFGNLAIEGEKVSCNKVNLKIVIKCLSTVNFLKLN